MHKLVESLSKSIQTSFADTFSSKLLEFGLQNDFRRFTDNEYEYLMMVNKMALNAPVDHLIRLHLSPTRLVSINHVPSCSHKPTI